uniref:Uncharacterized protein n=1 Tax=Eucampia antarctica TaxID=49252 RepID=A0A7S2R025_9STRA
MMMSVNSCSTSCYWSGMMKMTMMMVGVLVLMSGGHEVIGSSDMEVNDNDPNGLFLKACMGPRGEDDVEAVKSALKKGASINAVHEGSGQTCLMGSVLRGKINILKFLIKEGADPSIAEKGGYTPAHGAAFQGRADVMDLLIQADFNVNLQHEDGYVPLHRACWGEEQRHTDTVRVLLKHGIYHDVLSSADAENHTSMTCLQMTKNQMTKDLIANFIGTDNL